MLSVYLRPINAQLRHKCISIMLLDIIFMMIIWIKYLRSDGQSYLLRSKIFWLCLSVKFIWEIGQLEIMWHYKLSGKLRLQAMRSKLAAKAVSPSHILNFKHRDFSKGIVFEAWGTEQKMLIFDRAFNIQIERSNPGQCDFDNLFR